MLFLVMLFSLGWVYVAAALPDVDYLQSRNPQYTAFMQTDEYFSKGSTLPEPIRYVPLAELPRSLLRAVLVSEDDGFFEHDGFNWNAWQEAMDYNRKKGKFRRGASTITQQLARNLFLTRDKTILRKMREWILTWKLEHNLTKLRILELYLNVAEFGPGVYGIGQASRHHFNILPENLSASQSALLTAMLPSPKRYGKKPYPAFTWVRQKKILVRMTSFDVQLPSQVKRKDPGPLPATPQTVISKKSPPPLATETATAPAPQTSTTTNVVIEDPLGTAGDPPFLDE